MVTFDCIIRCRVALFQTKRVEKKAVSSSDSDEEKDDKITVAYKSTRSAVSRHFGLKKAH